MSVAGQTATADIVVFKNDEDDEEREQLLDQTNRKNENNGGGPQMPLRGESPVKKGARVRIYSGPEII